MAYATRRSTRRSRLWRTVAIACLALFVGPVQALDRESIRAFNEALETDRASALAGRTLFAGAELQAFYRDNQHRPVWTTGPLAQQRLAQLVTAIDASAQHGFNTTSYHRELLIRDDTPELAREVLATDAFLMQARHRTSGVVEPQSIDPEWHLPRDSVDGGALLLQATADNSVSATLQSLWPQSAEYRALLALRKTWLSEDALESNTVPEGPILKPGQSGQRILALKQRLLGPGEHTPDYDSALLEAVRAFQFAAGLEDDGLVGPSTLEVLNATRVAWIDRLDANLERWRWLPATIPDTYLRVNIAAFQLRVIESNQDQFSMRVIVGRPYRRTPVFTETMKYLVYNPYWNVPYSIATKDKLPLLQQNAAALQAQGYEARHASASDYKPVAGIDWAPVSARQFNYQLRQKPGPRNALGRIKFMLPNPFAVYLHDTPDHSLFDKQERSFSSGCIRLSEPQRLAHWILERDGQASRSQGLAQRLADGQTETVYLDTPLPVMILYLTAFTDDAGRVVFRRDIYQRDAAIVAALRGSR